MTDPFAPSSHLSLGLKLPMLSAEPWFIERLAPGDARPNMYTSTHVWRVFDENDFAVGFLLGFSPDEARLIAERIEMRVEEALEED